MNFSATLKKLRESRNLTQTQLAAELKVSRSTIAGYESKNRQPDFEKLIKLSEILGVSIDCLVTGNEEDDEPYIPYSIKSRRQGLTSLDRHVLSYYLNLSSQSKQDVLAYLRLLELRDRELAKKKR